MMIEIMAYKVQAEIDFKNGNYDEAKRNYTEAKTHEKFKDESKQDKAEIILGYAKTCVAYSLQAKDKMADLNSAQQALEVARDLYKGEPDSEKAKEIQMSLAEVYVNQGWIYFKNMTTLDNALSAYAEADIICNKYKISEEDPFVIELQDFYRCIMCQKADKAEDYDSKISYYEEAKKILERQIKKETESLTKIHILADIHYNMANVHDNKKNRTDAIIHYLIATTLYQELQEKDSNQENQKEYDKGLKQINKILHKSEYSLCPTTSSMKSDGIAPSIEPDESNKQKNDNNSGSSQFSFFNKKKKHTPQQHLHRKKSKKNIQSINANVVESDEEPLKRQKESTLLEDSLTKSLPKKHNGFKRKEDAELKDMSEKDLESYLEELESMEIEKTCALSANDNFSYAKEPQNSSSVMNGHRQGC